MSILSPDTSQDIEAMLLAMMRETPTWRKMELMNQLNATAREFAMEGLRKRFPSADQSELRRRLADLLLGPELALKVYGPLLNEVHPDV